MVPSQGNVRYVTDGDLCFLADREAGVAPEVSCVAQLSDT